MDFLSVLISLGMITLLIVVHEFGHFLAAKMYGFKTPVFGIGLPFGPAIDLGKKWDTEFKFYFALIGGFVAIPELGDESDPELLKKYKIDKLKEFPVGQRAVVAFGGIAFNILFAFLIAIIMAASIGLPKAVPSNAVQAFTDSSVAKEAGMIAGDKIIQVNQTMIKSGKDLQKAIKTYGDKDLVLKIQRPVVQEGAQEDSTVMNAMEIKLHSKGSLGVVLGYDKEYQKFTNPIAWVWEALKFTSQTLVAMLFSVLGLLTAAFSKLMALFTPMQASDVNLGEVKGIVGIVQMISQDIKSNAFLLFEFAFLLNLNLAVINLLPIPALDGGHLLFMAYEAIFGKKPPEKLQEGAVQAGFIFLLSIIAITTLNDLKNWIFG